MTAIKAIPDEDFDEIDDIPMLSCRCDFPLFFIHAQSGAIECGKCGRLNKDWALVRVQ